MATDLLTERQATVRGARVVATPAVSVIIPAYKTAHLIANCLDTVFAQTYTNFETIVVNDGSPDTPELEKVLAPYLDRIIYIKQENKRAAGARNNAIRQARGGFVAFLDSDDTWYPEHLGTQMKLFADDPTLDLTYSDGLMLLDGGQQRKFTDKNPSAGEATFAALVEERCQIPISTVVARKAALERAGLFDEKLPRCDDYDMWVRTAFCGAKIGYSPELGGTIFADRPGSLSLSRVKMVEAYWSILEKFRNTLPLSATDRAVVESRAAEIKARYLLEEGKRKAQEGNFADARKLISEANRRFHRSSLGLVVFGLSVAPQVTAKLMSYWTAAKNAE